jgi:hypothetical protein
MQSALTKYLKSRRSRLYNTPSAYQVLASDLLTALESDDTAHTALLAFSSARYRAQALAARAATIHAVAMLEGKEWQHDIDSQLTNWLLEQAGLDDVEGKIAALADAVARETDFGQGLYTFSRGILVMRQGAEEDDI